MITETETTRVQQLMDEEHEQMERRRLTFSSYLDVITVFLIENGELPSEAAA